MNPVKKASDKELSREELSREQLVQQWASFLKASFVYPDTNPRVMQPVQEIMAGLQLYRNVKGVLRICLHGKQYRVGNARVEIEKGMPTWCKGVFMKTAIAGVDLGPNLTPEALSQFTKRLQENFQREGGDFATKWPDRYHGVVPLELLVEGQNIFAQEVDDDALLRAAGAQDTVERAGFVSGSPEAKLLLALEANEELMERIENVRRKVNREIFNESVLTRADLLAQLVKALPAEALRDEQYAMTCVGRILEVAEIQLVAFLATGGPDMESELLSLMVNVGRKLFGAQEGDKQEILSDDLPVGRPGDERFQDDLQTLLQEFEAMPSGEGLQLTVDDVALKDEMLGIFVYELISTKDEDRARGLHEPMAKLADEAPHSGDLLNSYIDSCMANRGKANEQKTYWRVVDFVQRAGLSDKIATHDFLRPDLVAFAFPNTFGHLLDSLHQEREDDISKIADVCYGVGPDRIRAAEEILLSEDGIMTVARATKILASTSQDVVPLALIILEHEEEWTRPLIVQFLKRLKLPPDASLALRMVHPATELTKPYLTGLCEAALNGEVTQELVNLSASLVCRFIRATADDPKHRERRLYAIESLRTVRNEEVLGLLMELRLVCGGFSFNKELKAIRKAATEVLDFHKDNKGR